MDMFNGACHELHKATTSGEPWFRIFFRNSRTHGTKIGWTAMSLTPPWESCLMEKK
jgi:hypothetical protein